MTKPKDTRKSRWSLSGPVAMGVGLFIQAALSLNIFMAGLNWTGWQYWAAVGQALVGLVLILLLARRFPVVVLVVPIVSILVWQALWNAAMSERYEPRECTAAEEATLRELTPPDATLVDVVGQYDRCFATITSRRSADEVRTQYDREFVDHGWAQVDSGNPYATAAVRDELRVNVEALPEGNEFFIDLGPR